MKQNPYLTGLLTTAVLLLIFGGLAFVVGAINQDSYLAGATGLGAFLFPLGALSLVLWQHASALSWQAALENEKPKV